MSFVVKAVKKVFKKVTKFVKRVVKSDWFKVVAIVALSLFTAGVAAGGFAAFSGVSGVGSFFGAVGQTMANGWTAIANFATGQGFGLGATGGEALGPAAATTAESVGGIGPAAETVSMTGGTEAAAGGISEVTTSAAMKAGGLTDPAILSGVTSSGSPVVSTADMLANFKAMGGTVEATGSLAKAGGFLSKIGKLFTSNSLGGTFARNAVVSGIAGYFDEKDRKRQEFYFRNRTVWGGPAFGGTGEGLSLLSPRKQAQSDVFAQTPQEEAAMRQQEQAPTAEQTFGQSNMLAMQPQGQQQAQRAANAQMPQPTQPPPTNRPPVDPQGRSLLGIPQNLGVA
jgi:hypothetical protein